MSELQTIRAAIDEFRLLRGMGLGFKVNTRLDDAIGDFQKRERELVDRGKPFCSASRCAVRVADGTFCEVHRSE